MGMAAALFFFVFVFSVVFPIYLNTPSPVINSRPSGRCSLYSVGDVGHLDNADALTYGHNYGYDMGRKQSHSRASL